MSRLLGKIKIKIIFFLNIALYKFGHRKLDISKTVTARSFKLGQFIEDNEYCRLLGENLKQTTFF